MPLHRKSSPSTSASSSLDDGFESEAHELLAKSTGTGYSPSIIPTPSGRQWRRYIFAAIILVTAISLLGLSTSGLRTSHANEFTLSEDAVMTNNSKQFTPTKSPMLDTMTYLKGPPTDRFRDNLRPNMQYITSWVSAGWTNDVMTYINLIYLGIITERIPILPMFTPSHIGGSVPPIDFGKVFDVPRLQEALGRPILEWHQVKNRSSEVMDELGCWNTWEAVQEREASPRHSFVPIHLKLDISYTKTPTWIKVIPHFEHDMHSYFWALASLGFSEIRAENLVEPRESPNHHVMLPPDEQVLCYDYLYYVCAHQPFEFDFDYSPAWRFVGQYMHWAPELQQLADSYVRRTLDIEESQETPPWIAIHIRHGDFADWCGVVPVEECFAPLSVISRRVDEVKSELLERQGLEVKHVVMTSDERNTTWWMEVQKQGWYAIDHSQTVELYGAWFPVLIDAVIQSSGFGFVGTDRSTMSTLARRRVQSWRNGAVRTIKWGKANADDH